MTLSRTDLDHFLQDPSEYFGYSAARMLSMPKAEREELHLAGIRRRFEQFRHSIPMLKRLADNEGINTINQIGDVVPLLFDHATYKSYPVSLLDNHRYQSLTVWLNKLTTHDLSKVDVSHCRSIDDWMLTLKRETPMGLGHTSGTSGTISFLPWSKSEMLRVFTQWLTLFCQQTPGVKPRPPLNLHCLYPFFRDGGSVNARGNDAVVQLIAGSEERFHATYPGYQSADLMRLAAMHRAAVAKGQVENLEISPDLLARRDEFEALQRDMPHRAAQFFAEMCDKLAGQRIFMWGITNLLFALADKGLKQGISRLFTPDSVVVTGGGGKGMVLPDNWQQMVKDFLGVDRINSVYGMSETAGSPMVQCDFGHYHSTPNLVSFVLDPDSNALLPRAGRVTGRLALYDLIPDSHWGGFITGDEVTMEWDEPCACGRGTPYIVGNIQRFTDKSRDAGEEKINCAATPAAYDEALEFLNAETT